MKAAYYDRTGPAKDVLVVGHVDDPPVGPGEVLVKLHTSGVNPSDVKLRAGLRAGGMPFPRIIPHSDGAGVVLAVGAGVSAGRVGERVWLWNAQWGRANGTAASLIVVPSENAVPLPDRATFEMGACLGIPALTAHACLSLDGPLRGKTVLVMGGAGAVGALAVKMAKLKGAFVIASANGEPQRARAVLAGADVVVNHRSATFIEEVRDAAGARKINHVVEVEFGANIAAVGELISPGGVIATYGSAANPAPVVPFFTLLFKGVTVRHVLVYILSDRQRFGAIADINRWLASGHLAPEVARTLPLAKVAEAHELVERGGKLGSVVISVS